MSDTIQRLLVTFVDIIYSSNKDWTEGDILQSLHDKQFPISQSQLNRDLNRYHSFFNVERLDKYNSDNQTPVYRRAERSLSTAVMPEAEIEFLVTLSIMKERFHHLLSGEAQAFFEKKLDKMQLQRVRLVRISPASVNRNPEENLRLLLKFEDAGSIPSEYLKALSRSLHSSVPLEIFSHELPADIFDTFTPTQIVEENGDLLMTGMSKLAGDTNKNYYFSKVISVRCSNHVTSSPTRQLRQ